MIIMGRHKIKLIATGDWFLDYRDLIREKEEEKSNIIEKLLPYFKVFQNKTPAISRGLKTRYIYNFALISTIS